MQSANYGYTDNQRSHVKQSTWYEITRYSDLVLIIVPGDELADVALKCYGAIDYEWGIKNASTDFVSVLHT